MFQGSSIASHFDGGSRTATNWDISTYDAYVAAQANAVQALQNLGTTWSVIGSTSAVNAIDHDATSPDVAIYNLFGQKIADNLSDIFNNSQSPINVDQNGAVYNSQDPGDSSQFVWTGTTINGTRQEPLGGSTVALGYAWAYDPLNSGFYPTISGDDSATKSYHFYGISGVITVAAPAPEPSTAGLLVSSAVALFVVWKRRKSRVSAAV